MLLICKNRSIMNTVWNETKPDLFVIPNILLKDRFVEKGIDSSVILPTGIPVASRLISKKSTMKSYDKDMVLLTSGSMGFGNMIDIVKSILDNIDCHLVVVCGSNQKLKQELELIENKNLEVKGFINNLDEYIKMSSVVVAKPGGLTTTEVTMMRKPLIHMMPIPGVENYNAAFFANNKMSLKANTVSEIIDALNLLLKDKNLQKELISNQKKIINDSSAKDLVDFVIKNFE